MGRAVAHFLRTMAWMKPSESLWLRLTWTHDPEDEHAVTQAERSRSLRIGLLENGYNLVAVLPADVFLPTGWPRCSPT